MAANSEIHDLHASPVRSGSSRWVIVGVEIEESADAPNPPCGTEPLVETARLVLGE